MPPACAWWRRSTNGGGIYRTYSTELPTGAMVERAIPEGVLQPGGHISGFVYFQPVDRRVAKRTKRLTLLFEVRNAETGADIGQISIPLRVDP